MAKRFFFFIIVFSVVFGWASIGWAAASISVTGNGNAISDGSTTTSTTNGTDYGTVNTTATLDHDFIITNSGNQNLTITLPVTVSDTTNFSIVTQPSGTVASGGGQTTLTIRFQPQTGGAIGPATITINNNTNGPTGVFTFVVGGTGLVGAPEINVTGLGQNILSGDNTPSSADDTDYQDVNVGSTLNHTFTIQNTGNADLSVGTVTVSDTTNFSVITQPSSTVAGSSSTTAVIRFQPQSGGLIGPATVTIPNNDSNENPYTFAIQGTGLVAAPTVSTPNVVVATVEDTTATLGGNITSTGGENANERGIYWSLTSGFIPPAGTKVSQLGSYGTGAFTIPVTSLTAGSLIYFRAFAANSQGPGYSAEASFQTEPDLQPINLTFSTVNADSMTIGWSPQSGDGVIVVMKAGGVVNSDPVDFTEHGFNSSFGDVTTDLGGGNYVVYRGAGSSVNVSNLAAATGYYLAIYAYAGSGTTSPSGINYQQTSPLTGSQLTPAGPPALSAPTITGFADASTATLGATIDSDGGASITEYGTVWSATETLPTLATGTKDIAGGSFTPPNFFTHLVGDVIPMPAGKEINFRGYATNANSTGYSPAGIFYTEPDTQASGIVISNADNNSFDLSWTAGAPRDAYDGSIVVVRKGSAVIDQPEDGTTYLAGSYFGVGDELGIGNETFVVYAGSGTSVTVTGLSQLSTYYVAVYEYSGSGSEINYLLGPATSSQTTTKANSHREAYDIACGQCHASHGFGQWIPTGGQQEAMCKTCHNPIDMPGLPNKTDVTIHAGGTVDCGFCHEVHKADSQAAPQNILWTYNYRDGTTQENKSWIRGNVEKWFLQEPKKSLVALATPVVWHNASTEELASWEGVPGGTTIDDHLNSNGKLSRMCQACHTNPTASTKYHTDDPNDVNIKPTNVAAYTHPANVSGGTLGEDCRDCHTHSSGFAPQISETNCLSSSCHGGNTLGRRQITETSPGDGLGDFTTTSNSHHVNDGTGDEIVTRWDCIACHSEADAVTGAISSYHANGLVELRNADGSVTANTDSNGVYGDWAGIAPAARDEFCLSCHDSDGATIISTRTDPDPDATNNPLNPFNDGVTNAHEPNGLDGTPAPHARIRPTGTPGAGSAGVVDIKSKFNNMNAAYHGVDVDGDGCGPYTLNPVACPPPALDISGWDATLVNTAIQGVSTAYSWTSLLHCEDCHYGNTGNGIPLNGHGTTNSRYLLMDANGNDALGSLAGGNTICFRCHDPINLAGTRPPSSNYDPHTQDKNHQVDAHNIYTIGCLNCHGGGYPETIASGAIQWGAIHGVPATAPSPSVVPNLFVYGAGLGYITNWTPLGSPSCGAITSVTVMSDCTQHGGGSQSYTRTLNRTYPYP